MLSTDKLSIYFGGLKALKDLTIEVGDGEVVGLIGPNGAGKTTMFNVVSRIYQPTMGSVLFRGQELLHVPPHGIARLGIARTFQNLALFPSMSLLENVMVGAHSQGKIGRASCRERVSFLV